MSVPSKIQWDASNRPKVGSIVLPEVCVPDDGAWFAPVKPSPGPQPPGPYCRWQDRFPAAAIREQCLTHRQRMDGPVVANVTTWSIAWNEDPQPLLTLRQLRDEGIIDAIAVTSPSTDANCVVPLMHSGLVDAIVTPWSLVNQYAAAAIVPTAVETKVAIIATDVLVNLPNAEIADDLRRHRLDEVYDTIDASIQFAFSQSCVAAIMVDDDQVNACRRSRQKADLPESLMSELRRHHRS